MSPHTPSRHPGGTSAGGQFSTHARVEAAVTLPHDPPPSAGELQDLILDAHAPAATVREAVRTAVSNVDLDNLSELYPEYDHLEEGIDTSLAAAGDDPEALDRAAETYRREIARTGPAAPEEVASILAAHLHEASVDLTAQRAERAFAATRANRRPTAHDIRDAYEPGDPKRFALLADAGLDPLT